MADHDRTEIKELRERIRQLEAQADRAASIEDIKVLQRTYGYCVDKALWNDVADLFADDGEIEIGGRGVYAGRERIREFLTTIFGEGQVGLRRGQLLNHMQLQGIVSLDPSGETASGRWRAFIQAGRFGEHAQFAEGTYENLYRREDGIWKIVRLTWFATYYTPYEKGFGVETLPLTAMSEELPPDREPTYRYAPLPDTFVPPFHYVHPVTGRPIDAG